MYCNMCGFKVADGSRFCSACGSQLPSVGSEMNQIRKEASIDAQQSGKMTGNYTEGTSVGSSDYHMVGSQNHEKSISVRRRNLIDVNVNSLKKVLPIVGILLSLFAIIFLLFVPFYGTKNKFGVTRICFSLKSNISDDMSQYEVEVCNGSLLNYAKSYLLMDEPSVHIVQEQQEYSESFYDDSSYDDSEEEIESTDQTSEYGRESAIQEARREKEELDHASEYGYEPESILGEYGNEEIVNIDKEVYAEMNSVEYTPIVSILFYVLAGVLVLYLLTHFYRKKKSCCVVGVVSGVVAIACTVAEGVFLGKYVPNLYEFILDVSDRNQILNESTLLFGFYGLIVLCLGMITVSAIEIKMASKKA